MIIIKNKQAIQKMFTAGQHLADLFIFIEQYLKVGVTTFEIDLLIEGFIKKRGMVSETKGYAGYRHASCLSLNDELVHGVPSKEKVLCKGDLLKIDVCASWKEYCADMARPFVIAKDQDCMRLDNFIIRGKEALDAGIECMRMGKKLYDVSAAIEGVLSRYTYGIVRDFVGHGIGKSMHEDPEVPNQGSAGRGPRLMPGMAFAIEPMYTESGYEVYITDDEWTVKTKDKSLAMHIEDTVIITESQPLITTRHCNL